MNCFPKRPVWAEVDLDAIAHNVREFLGILPRKTRLMAVLKADGYGHGAVEVAKASLEAGATFIGTALTEEAVELRENGITAPILVLGFTPATYAPLLFEYEITPTVFTMHEAKAFSDMAVKTGKTLNVHVKADTGMSRIGVFPCERAFEFVQKVLALPGLKVEGLYTHFASADAEDMSYAREQLAAFVALDERLKAGGMKIPILHAANSAAAMFFPESHLDMVRIGISLYGLYPAKNRRDRVRLKPAMSLKARIVCLKDVPPATRVSYGCTYVTKRESRLATLPLGYADGYPRLLSNRGRVLVGGQTAPVAGRVCMDQLIVDVTGIPGVCEGDEAVLFGTQQGASLSADEVADWLGTINYEVVTALRQRVPRIYYKNNHIVGVRDIFH